MESCGVEVGFSLTNPEHVERLERAQAALAARCGKLGARGSGLGLDGVAMEPGELGLDLGSDGETAMPSRLGLGLDGGAMVPDGPDLGGEAVEPNRQGSCPDGGAAGPGAPGGTAGMAGAYAAALREACGALLDFFDAGFGEGTSNALFGEETDLGRCLEAYRAVERGLAGALEALEERLERYRPRRCGPE